jgi:predicted lipoprotein with Yx(FWY)xxD motif
VDLSFPGTSSSHPDANNREEEPATHTSTLTHKRRRRALLAVPAAFVAAVGLAACSSAGATSPSSSSGGATVHGTTAPSASNTPASAASGTALALRSTSLGRILTDGRGFTVYDFEADKGTTSNCTGTCATAWPPVLAKAAAPQVGPGVKESLVGETTRADGAKQLTYGGRPLYYYAGDSAPGSTTGQGSAGFGAPWYVLAASGQEVKTGG